MKGIILKFFVVLCKALIATGEVGLILFSLSFLWTVGKFEFFATLILAAIFTVVDKFILKSKE